MDENIRNTFVIDASFMLAFLLPDEHSKQVDATFIKFKEGRVSFIAPFLLPFEVINSLLLAVTRKRISGKVASEIVREFLSYEIDYQQIDFRQLLPVAQKYQLTAYDSTYLLIAQENNIPLLTLDKQLKRLVLD